MRNHSIPIPSPTSGRQQPNTSGLSALLSSYREPLLLTAFLALAAVLRLGWPGLTEFKLDEAHLMARALAMADGGPFAVRGISSSIGFPNFPMSVWLYALPLLVWQHVYAATLFTGALNTLAVLGCYWFVRRYWGPRAALAAALMFAVSPWALHHARKIWAQNLLPVFVVGWGISGALAFVERRARLAMLHVLCLGVAAQTHPAAVGLAPATLIALLIFRQRVRWRWIVAGAVLVLASAAPFLIYIAGRLEATLGALRATGSSEPAAAGAALRLAWLLVTGQEIHALAGPDQFRAYLATVPDATAVHWLWGTLSLGGALLLLRAWLHGRHGARPTSEAGLLVVLWLLSPLVVFSLPGLPVTLHYLLPIYPAPYIAAGALFAALARRVSGRWSAVLWGILLLSALGQIVVWGQLLRFTSDVATPGGLGVPVARRLGAAAAARQMMVATGAAEVLVAGPGASLGPDEFAAVFDVLLWDLPRRFVDARDTAVFPAAPAVVVLDQGAGPGAALYRAAARHESEASLRAGEGSLRVLDLPAGAAPAPEILFDPLPILTNWVALHGHDPPADEADGTALWRLNWYTGEATAVDFHLYAHLLDAGGRRVSQRDGPVFDARQWRRGDEVVTVFRLAWPADAERPLAMRVGMYTFPEQAPVEVFDVAGNVAGEWVTVPLP